MVRMYKVVFVGLTFLFFLSDIYGQEDKNWMEYDSDEVETTKVSGLEGNGIKQKLDFTEEEGVVIVNHDKKIDEIIELLGTPIPPNNNVQMNGYRIQVYFSQDKNEANQTRAGIIALNIGVPTYLDYQAPNFRVRIGDFRTKLEAEKIKQELKYQYPGAVIVESRINLPSLEKEAVDEE